MIDASVQGPACRPNFSAAGRQRRRTVALIGGVITVALFVGLALAGAPLWARLIVALPAMMTAITGLQVSRNTCVAHAATGMFENDDFTTTKVDADFASASRRVARTIYRDGALVGVAAGVLGAASSFL